MNIIWIYDTSAFPSFCDGYEKLPYFFIALSYPQALDLENFNKEIFLFLSPLNSAEKRMWKSGVNKILTIFPLDIYMKDQVAFKGSISIQ